MRHLKAAILSLGICISGCTDDRLWQEVEPHPFVSEMRSEYKLDLPEANDTVKYAAASHVASRGEFIVLRLDCPAEKIEALSKLIEQRYQLSVESDNVAERLQSMEVSENILWWPRTSKAMAKVFSLKPRNGKVILLKCFVFQETKVPYILFSLTPRAKVDKMNVQANQ